jgi:hypothetical protein
MSQKQKTSIPQLSFKLPQTDFAEKLSSPNLLLELCSTSYVNAQAQFTVSARQKYMKAVAAAIPTPFKLFYSSQNSTKGLTDLTSFFPESYSIKRMCILIMPELTNSIEGEEEDPIFNFVRRQSMLLKGCELQQIDKDMNLVNVGKVFDTLAYNGFNAYKEIAMKIEREADFLAVLEKVMDADRSVSFMKFLLSHSSDLLLRAVAATKVGMTQMLSFNPFSLETFCFASNNDTYQLFNFFFPELSHFQRTLVVFRPLAVRSGLNRVFLDILKCNQFCVVKRKFKVLSKEEALQLKGNLILDAQGQEDYLTIMLAGECDLCVIAKFGAIHEARTLVDGAEGGRRRIENALIGAKSLHVDHEKEFLNPYAAMLDDQPGRIKQPERTTIRETLTTFPSDGVNSLYTLNPFSSFSEVLELTSILESGIQQLEHNTDQPSIYRRQRALEELREFTRNFNVLMHCSSSSEHAQTEVLTFFPKLAEYSTAILEVRPEAHQNKAQALELLQHLGLRIIKQESFSAPSESAKPGLGIERLILAKELIHVSKAGCIADLTALASMKTSVTFPLAPHHMPEMFKVYLDPAEFESGLRQLHPTASSFSGEYLLGASIQVQKDVASYCLFATTGETIDTKPLTMWEAEDSHAILRGTGESGQCREVRVRKNIDDDKAKRSEITSEYECVLWFYKEVREQWPYLVPPYFHYRIEPSEPSLQLRRVFTVEQSMGEYFLPTIALDMELNRARELRKFKVLSDKSRGSAVAFIWGRKLAWLCQRIEECKSEEIEDCGPLYWNGTEILGKMDDLNFVALEYQRFSQCLEDLRAVWLSYIPVATALNIETKVLTALNSAAFQQSRQISEVALVPDSLKYSNIRAIKYTKLVSQMTPDELSEFNRFHLDVDLNLDLEHEAKFDPEVMIHDFVLMDVAPAKYTKRHMAANLIWLLQVRLKKLDRKLQVTKGDPNEYEALLDSMTDGFMKKYPANEAVDNVAFFRMELLLFSLWEAWKVLRNMQALQDIRAAVIEERDRLVRSGTGIFKQIVEEKGRRLREIDEERESFEYEMTLMLEHLGTVTIEPELTDEERRNMKVGHERYFKFFGLDDYDPDIANKRYPDRITAQKFPSLAVEAVRNLTKNPSSLEQRWLNPRPYDGSNIREVPDDAYRLDSTAVKKTRWYTQEKQKQLLQDALKTATLRPSREEPKRSQ